MQTLLTNDDGLHAPGLRALHDALAGLIGDFPGPLGSGSSEDSLVVVAPLTVQSATSHGVTFDTPLMTRREPVHEKMIGIAVDGRPADCVKLALSTIWPERFGEGTRPSLLVSGMNAGANCGVNVIYSGTVAAAIEGAFLGIPSIAVSLHIGKKTPRFDVAAIHARQVIERLLQERLEPHSCLNINIPTTESEGPMPPVRFCPMNTHALVDRYEARVSPGGSQYYWSASGAFDFHQRDRGTDVEELFERSITITPLRYDLTDPAQLQKWRQKWGQDELR